MNLISLTTLRRFFSMQRHRFLALVPSEFWSTPKGTALTPARGHSLGMFPLLGIGALPNTGTLPNEGALPSTGMRSLPNHGSGALPNHGTGSRSLPGSRDHISGSTGCGMYGTIVSSEENVQMLFVVVIRSPDSVVVVRS